MDLGLSFLSKYFLYKFKDEPELLRSIKRLQELFTVKRADLDKYGLDEKLVSAYAAFYFPTNVKKLEFVLEKIPEEIKNTWDSENTAFIDWGCGPGTYSYGLTSFFRNAGRFFLADQSELMRKQAGLLLSATGNEKFSVDSTVRSVELEKFENKVLLFGNVANEMGLDKTLQIIKNLNPNFILFIEPGTKDSYRLMMELRKELGGQNFACLFPCSSSNGPCPMEKDNWCHFTMKTTHDPEIERISQILKMDRRHMPLISHLYQKNGMEKEVWRVIRLLKETKFSLNFECCWNNKIVEFELMKGKMKKKDLKVLTTMSAGKDFDFEITKQLSDRKYRGNIRDDKK